MDHQLPERQAAASEAWQTPLQDSHHQHWRPSGFCSLPTLLSLLKWLHIQRPLCQAHEVIGLIKHRDESAYQQEVEQLAVWCSLNKLELNTLKTVESSVDFSWNPPALPPLTIMNSTVAAVDSFRLLGTTISQDLKWDNHIDTIAKKAQLRLYFLHQLRKFNLPQELLKQFYSAIIESVLCSSITSQVTYVTMVPRMGNETLRPLGVATGNALSVTRVWRYICKNTTCWPATAHDVTTGVPQYKCRRENTSSASSSEACVRSMAQSLGDAVRVPMEGNVSGYVCNHGSPNGEWDTDLGVATGNVIPTSPCWGECKPISRKRRALSQLYPAKGVAPGTADGCQWYYPLRPKARAAYPSTYLLGAGITGPRVEVKVLESEKDSFKGIWPGTWSLGPGRSLRGYHLLCPSLLRELSQQTSW